MKNFIALILSLFNFLNCAGSRPADLGVSSGMLKACPSSPNCVSTQAADAKHRMEPIPFSDSPEESLGRIVQAVNSMERTEIVSKTGSYLHAEFASKLWGFVDDVEFYLDEDKKLIHFRSASRLGCSDLGANRKRMKALTAKLAGGG